MGRGGPLLTEADEILNTHAVVRMQSRAERPVRGNHEVSDGWKQLKGFFFPSFFLLHKHRVAN